MLYLKENIDFYQSVFGGENCRKHFLYSRLLHSSGDQNFVRTVDGS